MSLPGSTRKSVILQLRTGDGQTGRVPCTGMASDMTHL
eukprot:COSAG01_NODE_2364_length_7819_cov_14.933549_6_plen_38_part_00